MRIANRLLILRIAASALILLIITMGGCSEKKEKGDGKRETEETEQREFSKEVEKILEKKMALIEKLAQDPLTLEAVKESNQKNRERTLAETLELDARWREATSMDEFIKTFITSEYAQYLVDFQEANSGFPEIFVTDEKGLIVAETNRTSDYYQADESWWINAYDQGKGKAYHGEIEYDESAQAESIALYVPVIGPRSKQAIGVIKAVCDITDIKMEL